MHYNYKLKQAVTAALSLIAIGFHSSSFSLGLSDIEIQSHLGEPLKANISMLGADGLKDPSCLKLGANSDLSHVNFKLGKINGGNASLVLTTNQIINEPIVNLSVVAGCDNVVTRDYVLLLDPPASLLGEEVNPVSDAVVVQKIDIADNSSPVNVKPKTQKSASKTAKNKRSAKKSAPKSRRAKKVSKKSTGAAKANNQITPEKKVAATPKLSISSGMSKTYANSVGLQLDKQLRFQPDPNAVATSESIAIEDEVTVMNNRLAHLQAQITKLQKQNTELKTDNKLKSKQLSLAKDSSSPLSSILLFLSAGLLLLGGYAGYRWFRRRETLIQNHNTDAIWIENNEEVEKGNEQPNQPETIIAAATEEDIFSDVDFGINAANSDESASPTSMESTFESTKTKTQPIVLEDEEQFSVLDHADVFLSHGRATLAIQLLQNHLLEHPKQSVTIWLFLLDLLAKENLKSLYDETALDCKLHFNVKIAEFSKQEATTNESLEDFPHLARGLEEIWNTPASVVYLEDLIYNNRLEPRAGLSKNLIEELVLLRSLAQENTSSAEVIQLDEKKIAIIEQKEALLADKKAEKLKKMEEAEKLALEKAQAEMDTDTNSTSFEFTLVERN